MFRAVLRELMMKLAASEVRDGGVLEGFRDVLVADAMGVGDFFSSLFVGACFAPDHLSSGTDPSV